MEYPQTIKVELKAEHFNNGDYTDPWKCPLATAVQAIDDRFIVAVDSHFVHINDREYKILADTSDNEPFHEDGYSHDMYELDKYTLRLIGSEDVVRMFILELADEETHN